ncbi:TonB-dependent siderophore receptor [Ancylobacter oerskovii]|uniref:TonB-dependent siderophore receptor n=1 Tax=Ancylobacter oerskovii TaxID=459519 RepID=UPI0031B83A81
MVLDTITVEGDSSKGPDDSLVARRSEAGSKTDTPLIEIPQAVSVVTRRQMDEQAANTISEALRYTPGVLAESNGFDIRYDWIWIRGFNTYGTIWLDGLTLPGDPSNYATPSINPYALERIEVIKGPASVLYGRAVPGGLINYVSKRPQPTAHNEIEFTTTSWGGIQTSVDFTGPLTKDGEWLYRLVGQGRNFGTQIDSERDRQIMLAPSFTWSPTDQTSLTLYGYYQRDDPKNFNPRFYPAVGTLLPNPWGQIPRDLNLGDPAASQFNREFYALGYEFEHEFSETWTFRQNLRYAESSQDMFLVLVNPAFAYRPDGHTLNRVSGASDDQLSSFNVDNQLEARFGTGAFDHTVLMGFDYIRATSDRNFGNSANGVPTLDYLDPVYGTATIPYPAYTTSVLQEQEQAGFYVQDQIRYDRWMGTFGLRYDMSRIDTTNRITNAATVSNEDNRVTGRAGLTYLFDNGLAPYASYSTSFLPLLGTDINGQPYQAQTAEQYEIGVKYEPPGIRGLLTFSLFNINMENALTPAYVSGTQIGYVQTGEQRVRGFEVEGKFELTPEIDLMAAYAYTHSEVVKSNNPVELGQGMLRLPEHQASLWVNYEPTALPGLSLGAGVRGISSYQTDATYLEQLRIPGRTLVDVGVAYDFGKWRKEFEGTTARLNVSNLFDEEYVSHCLNLTGASCNYGAGRVFTASLKYSW